MKKAAAESTMQSLLARNYGVRLWRRDDRIIAEIEELSLVQEANSVEAALELLDRRKHDHFAALHRLGRTREIPLPVDESPGRAFWLQHRSFCFKVLFSTVAVGFLLLAVVPAIRLQLGGLKRDLQVAGRSIPNGIFEGLEGLKAMPEERQKRVAAGLRTFIEALGPVIKEGKAALQEQGVIDPAAVQTKQPDGR